MEFRVEEGWQEEGQRRKRSEWHWEKLFAFAALFSLWP